MDGKYSASFVPAIILSTGISFTRPPLDSRLYTDGAMKLIKCLHVLGVHKNPNIEVAAI